MFWPKRYEIGVVRDLGSIPVHVRRTVVFTERGARKEADNYAQYLRRIGADRGCVLHAVYRPRRHSHWMFAKSGQCVIGKALTA